MVIATVSTINKQIVMHAETLVHLPAAGVRAPLLDFDNLPQVITDLKEVHILASGENGPVRMQVVARVCIAVFCLSVNQQVGAISFSIMI